MTDDLKAELKSWRWEWGPALLAVYILVDGLINWDPTFTAPWLLAAVGVLLLARAGRRAQSSGAADGPGTR